MPRVVCSCRLILLLTLCWAFAKTGYSQPQLPGSQVRVEKLFDARLTDAERVELSPTLPALDTTIQTQRYEVVPVRSDIAYNPPKIKPLAIKTAEPDPAYKGFARLGAGYPLAWIGDLGYVTRTGPLALRSDLHAYGFRGNYNDDQRYNEVSALLGASYFADNGLSIDLDFDFDRRDYRYYGFAEAVNDTSRTLTEEQVGQHFGNFGVHAGIRNSRPTTSGIDYYGRIGFDILADNFASKERRTQIEAGGRKDFSDNWYAELGIDLDLLNFEADTEQKLNNYSLLPTVGAHFDQFGVRLGARISNSSDTFRLFPALELSYGLGGGFVAVLGADGGFRQNGYRNLTAYMPYLVRDPRITNAEHWRAYAKFQGHTQGVTYTLTASYSHINDLAVFFQDSLLEYKFRPAYDTADVIGFKAEAAIPISQRITGSLLLENRIFSQKRFERPYLLPSFDAQLRIGYTVIPEKLNVEGIFVAQNALPWAGIGPTDTIRVDAEDTGVLLDLSFHGDYTFSQKISAFAQFNNLFNNRRRMFPYYPTIGANILLGLRARF